eukprot:gene4275-7611_t
MSTITAALIFVLTILLLCTLTLYYYNGFSTAKGEPTLLRGTIPVFGVMFELERKGLYQFVLDNVKKYGSIFTVFLLGVEFASILKHSDDFENEGVRSEVIDPVKKFLMGDGLEVLTKEYGRRVVEKFKEEFKKGSADGKSMDVDLLAFTRKELNPEIFTKSIFEARERVLEKLGQCDLKNEACGYVKSGIQNKSEEKAANNGFGILGFHKQIQLMNDELKKQITAEISEQFSVEEYEKSIDSMKYLHGAYLETMRFHNLGVSMREALEDTKKGDRIYMLPVAYKDPEVFPNPEKFDATRYIGKQSEKMIKPTIPFGGGVHMCPGRFFAINEIKLFSILIP